MLRYRIFMKDSRNMSEVENESVDLILTSPPYFNLIVFSEDVDGDLSRISDKSEFFKELSKVWKECYRVLKNGGYLICEFEDYPVGSRFVGYPWEILLAGDMNNSIESVGFRLISRWYVRKFSSGTALSKFQYTLYSSIENFRVDPRAISNVAYSFVYKKGDYIRKRKLDFSKEEWKNFLDGFWDIDFISNGAEGIEGGAVFPLEYARRCIRIYSSKYDTVLDPFLGTGTTMRACFELQRNCIGYEVNKKMVDIIKKKVGFGSKGLVEEVKWEID